MKKLLLITTILILVSSLIQADDTKKGDCDNDLPDYYMNFGGLHLPKPLKFTGVTSKFLDLNKDKNIEKLNCYIRASFKFVSCEPRFYSISHTSIIAEVYRHKGKYYVNMDSKEIKNIEKKLSFSWGDHGTICNGLKIMIDKEEKSFIYRCSDDPEELKNFPN